MRRLIDAAAIGAALIFTASYFPPDVMFAPTTTNGGDMGSHYFPAAFLREVLLPRGQVVGWCPGNYCGFPLFQFYFPLPFVLMAVASLAIPLTVAFKLVTVLGSFLLVPCSYLGLRLLRVPFPGPALGGLVTLCFLFMEANSMWGGNIPSTLAGEFTFSVGMALAVLFVGAVNWTAETGRGRIWNGLLVAGIGLCHGYALLWAGVTSCVVLVAIRQWWRRLGTLVAVHGLAILLLGWWLVPLLGYSSWTTAYSHVWHVKGWREVLPPILWPAAGLAVGATLVLLIVTLKRREPFPRGLATLWTGALVGVLFYFTARTFQVVDIRFLPFFQLGLCLAAAAGLGHLVAKLPGAEIWPLVGGLAILPFVESQVSFISSWVRWNYSGFEEKAPWPVFRDINEKVRGDFRDPRVVFEHSSDHEALGTIRAFESLPLFSGRSTLEGLYMQASPVAPFVFYTQSEISKQQSCPFPHYGCSRLDLDRGVDHLRMFNVSHFIVRSSEVKAAAAAHPAFTAEATVGEYQIYRVEGNAGRYAIPLEVAPVLVLTKSWKEPAYLWFKRARPADPVLVFAETATAEEKRSFAAAVRRAPYSLPRQPLGSPPALSEHLETDRITVTGCRPGHPVLIRISYHPRWQALTGERVWLAAPSFMLVFPRGERIDLAFAGGGPVTVGRVFTIVGVLVVVGALLPVRRRLARLWQPLAATGPVPAVVAMVRRTERWTPRMRLMVLATALVVAASLCATLAVWARGSDADSTYRRGQRIYDAGRLEDALPHFRKARRLAPLSNTAIHSSYYESIILYRLERWVEAEQAFQRLLENYPEAAAAAESLYHVGLCRARRGESVAAVDAWQETRRRFPRTQWAGYARDRLVETLGKDPDG